MEDRLRRHIEELFAETAPTRKAVELKEEMLQNLTEKYADLLGEGKSPEAAYNIAVAGIGDISGLLEGLENDAVNIEFATEQRRRSALLTAIAVMLYILSALPLIVISIVSGTTLGVTIGLIILFIMVAAATGLLIYNGMTKTRHNKSADTMVDEFRQWQSGEDNRKNLRRAISAALWSLIVALYFIISFTTFAWQFTWVLFILGAMLESLISITFAMKK